MGPLLCRRGPRHSIAVIWFLPLHWDACEFDAGAPVVMVELPEVQAASATPPSDLVPGPPEAESTVEPPKEEQTKPPEQEAEVALPIPDPPTPTPPTEVRPPTAQPSVGCRLPAPRWCRPRWSNDGRTPSSPISSASSATPQRRVPVTNAVSPVSRSPSTMRAGS